MATKIEETPFVKQLASSDKPTRDKALSSLRTYLSPNRTFTTTECLKIWKGLFYCVHHTPPPLPSQRLCASLTTLLDPLPRSTFIPFITAFWTTISSNYSAIPSLRLDKYLLLIRYYIASSFSYLAEHAWDTELVREYLALLGDSEWGPLTVGGVDGVNGGRGGKVPDGLRYHVLDIWVDGLENVVEGMDEGVLGMVMGPVRRLVAEGKTKVLRKRARGVLGDERLEEWMGESGSPGKVGDGVSVGEQHEDNDEQWDGFGD